MNANTIAADLLSAATGLPDMQAEVLDVVADVVGGMADMRLSHTPGVGTVLEFPRNKAWSEVITAMRHPRFIWSGSRGAHYVQHTADQRVPRNNLDEIAATIAREIPGVRVSVVVRSGRVASVAEREAERKERAEARQERFKGYSASAEGRSGAARGAARSIMGRWYLGQPILVGHHSERRARRDRERVDELMQKSVGEYRKSEHWQSRAAGSKAHAERREAPGVIMRRIVGKEKELRDVRRKMQGSPGHNAAGRPAILKPSES